MLDRARLIKKYGKNSSEIIEFFLRYLEFIEDKFNERYNELQERVWHLENPEEPQP